MEELSFKLLNEGLGFYEKNPFFDSTDQKKTNRGSLFSSDFSDLDLLENLDLDDVQNYEQLLSLLERPYLGEKENNFQRWTKETSPPSFSPVAPSSAVNEKSKYHWLSEDCHKNKKSSVFSSPTKLARANQESVSSFSAQPVPVEDQKTSSADLCFEKTFYFSLKAYLTDAFVVSMLLFPSLILFVFLTQSDPIAVFKLTWLKILFVFLLFAQMYCLLCRLFCFETFGEAFAKIRLSTLRSQKEVHPFRLFWRFFLSCLTGVVFFPLLSALFRKDFMARLTGLYFQKI